jgi:hypothetical protein
MTRLLSFVSAGAVGAVMMVGFAEEAPARAAECKVPQPVQMFPLAALLMVVACHRSDCCGLSYDFKNSIHHDKKRHARRFW